MGKVDSIIAKNHQAAEGALENLAVEAVAS